MADALKEFFVSLGLESDAASFASAQASVDALEKGLQKLVEWANRAGTALVDAVVGTAAYGSRLDDASKKTGLSTQAIEEWTYAASLVGGSGESFQNGVIHMAKAMGQVRTGSKEAIQAFSALGVRVFDTNGKFRDQEEVMNDVADALAALPEGAARTDAAIRVFGKSGADMIPLLADGSAKLREMRDQFRAIVGTLSGDQIRMLDKFDDSTVTLRAFGDSIVREFAMPIVEALQPVVDQLMQWITANRDLISQKVAEWGKRVASIVVTIAKAAEFLIEHFDGVVSIITDVAVAFALVAATILITTLPALYALVTEYALVAASAIVAAAASIGAWLAAAAPIIGIIALVGLVVLVFEDLYYFLTGGESLIGHILDRYWDKIDGFLQKARKGINEFMTTFFGPLGSLAFELGLSGIDKAALAIGDFVAGGAQSPAAAAVLQNGATSNTTNNKSSEFYAPMQINVQTQPGQSNAEVGKYVGDEVLKHLESEYRKAHGS